jgi:hypothetical protein
MLAYLDVLKYSDSLVETLKEKIIHSGDRIEVEIRGASIWAVEVTLPKNATIISCS